MIGHGEGGGFNKYANFETFSNALFSLMRMATADAWSAQLPPAVFACDSEAEVEVKEAGDESDTDAERADSADEVAVAEAEAEAEAEADAEAKEVRTRVRMRCGGLLRACAAALHSAT